jgi:hypothetical protein
VDPDELDTAVITDGVTPGTTIVGWKIADQTSWRTSPDTGEPSARWSHQRVWKLESGGYVVARMAYSMVYHRAVTRCLTATGDQRGSQMTREKMLGLVEALDFGLDDLVACEDCQPPYPEELKAGAIVRYEKPRVTIDQCESADALVRRLTVKKRRGGVLTTTVHETTRALLEECARNDPTWAITGEPAVIR